MTSPETLIRREGRAGRITLNRPEALNALTYGMIGDIRAALETWKSDPAVAVVILDGEGGRALCAGGDVITLYNSGPRGSAPDPELAARFWRDEYHLNAAIKRYPKPYVAMMDGIVMGGGVGVSAHGRQRVVTEKSMIAMPETGIGLIPDVGGTFLLGHAQGRYGEYLGLTGARMDGADAIQAGFADIFMARANVATFVARLCDAAGGPIDEIIEQAADGPVPVSKLAGNREMISKIFAGDTVEAVQAAALGSADAFAQKVVSDLHGKSPKALKLTLAAIRAARKMTALETALQMEYRLVTRLFDDGEFIEGVRALLVDKDKAPKWNPATAAAVTPQLVAEYLGPLMTRTELDLKAP
jgi:enoyl-CoA hydratase